MGHPACSRSRHGRTPGTRAGGYAVAVVLAAALSSTAQPPAPEPKPAEGPKSPPATKDPPKATPSPGIKLPDGTYLWTGPASANGEQVLLPAPELQKLLDQVEQLKKQLAARRPARPSGCAIRGRVERRGETLVAALTLTYTFRTAAPNAPVALGGRRGFLVAAALDGNRLPVLDTGEDGFAALVEAPGDHTLTLDLEAPVAGRGTKNEIGFEIGLPRAAITTLVLDPPPGVERVSLTTRTPDPTQLLRPIDTRRVPGLDVKQLAPGPGPGSGYPLGPVESLEVTWDPPAASATAAGAVQSADLDVTCLIAEAFVETTAKVRLRGPAREWRLVAPVAAEVTAERAAAPAPAAEPGPAQPPTITRPEDDRPPVWVIDLPAGAAAAARVVNRVCRQPRPTANDPKRKGPFPVGPLTVADVARQTGTVRVTAAGNTRLSFRHGPDLRRAEPPGPADDEVVTGFFRLATGPTGKNPAAAPLLTVEAQTLPGSIRVRPAYRLRLTEAGWRVRAEVRVTPIKREVDAVTVEVPDGWRGLEASPPELVEGVQVMKSDGPRTVVSVRLAAAHRQPFDLVLEAIVPVPPGAREAAVPLPRFPGGAERDAQVTATVPDGQEVRGSAHEWDADQPAGWGQPLAPAPGPDGKAPKAVTAVAGRFDHALARVDLAWHPYQPELTAEIRAEVTVQDRQVVVQQQVRLRSPDGFGRPVRFRGPSGLAGLRVPAGGTPLSPLEPGEWVLPPAGEAVKEQTVTVGYAVPLPARGADDRGPWQVPVGLLWPAATTRTETTARVWSQSANGRKVAVGPGPWRELPAEPVPERDALPAATLAGSGPELPLVIEVREAETAAAAVWVERAVIQAWAGDDGGTAYRARFLLRRWLAAGIAVRVPGPPAGPEPELLVDGRRVEAAAVADPTAADRTLRVPLPEARAGRTVVLEVRYRLPPRRSGEDPLYLPPVLPDAAFAGPTRWQVTVPAGSVPLVPGGAASAELRWRSRWGMLSPAPAVSADDLDRWFRSGAEPDEAASPGESAAAAGEPVVFRQATPAPVRVYRVPRVTLVAACSLAVLVLGLALARLPGWLAGPAVAFLGGAAAVAAVLVPQPAAAVAGACQPGLAALILVLVVQAAGRAYYRRRLTRLPGFTRTRLEPALVSANGPAPSVRGRPPARGSTGSHSPAEPAPSGS
jgi:hypothetical protein